MKMIKLNTIFRYTFILVLLLVAFASNAQQTSPKEIVVAQDGSGNFKLLQDAIDAVRAYTPEHINIKIKAGVYHEKIVVHSWVTNISFIGEDKDKVIITNDDYSGKFMSADTVNNKKKFSTFNSYTVLVHGNDVSFENLTIQNTAGRVGQAVALHVDGDRFVIKNCKLLGNQDTLLTANDSSKQYYYDCYIEGTTDFIFGPATAVFQNCTIKSLSNSYVTAASTTQKQPFGYVFFNCKLIASTECTKEYLGRPWRAYAKVVFYQCELGSHIRAEGWHNWGKAENESTAFYAEYKNIGEGANTANRVKWSHVLTDAEAKEYTVENIFKGWKPETK